MSFLTRNSSRNDFAQSKMSKGSPSRIWPQRPVSRSPRLSGTIWRGAALHQMHTLEVLGIHKAMRMKELAQHMGITTGTLTVLVDRLEDKDFVFRKPHQTDRRSILVELTEEGQKMFMEHDRLHLRLTEELTSEFSEEEKAILLGCID